MNEKTDRLLKNAIQLSLLPLLLFLPMLFIFGPMQGAIEAYRLDVAILGALSIWCALIVLKSCYNSKKHEMKSGSRIVHIIDGMKPIYGGLSYVIGLVVAVACAVVSISDSELSIGQIKIIWISLPLLFLCLISIYHFSLKQVKTGSVVRIKDKYYLPGEIYRLWPFFIYDEEVIREDISIVYPPKKNHNKMLNARWKFHIKAKINIYELASRKVRNINWKYLKEELEKEIFGIIDKNVETIKTSDLVTNGFSGFNKYIGNVLVSWSGRVYIETLPIDSE